MAGQASKVSGTVQIDGAPAERTVRAFGYEATTHDIDATTVNLSKSLGHATSDPATGAYTIDLLGGYGNEIFVVAFDDYGADFTPDMAVSVGDRVHPTTPNGHVYECTGAGTLPAEEPVWVVDTETAQLYGTASMIAKPFYRPMVHGPVAPEVTGTIVEDPDYNSVALLMHMDGTAGGIEFVDNSPQPKTLTSNSAIIRNEPAKFGQSAEFTNGGYLVSEGFLLDPAEFTIEIQAFFASGSRLDSDQALLTQWDTATASSTDGFMFVTRATDNASPPNALSFDWRSGGTYVNNPSAPFAFVFDRFYHIALTRKNDVVRYFVDGAKIAEFTATTAPNPTTVPMWIGRLNHSSVPMRLNGFIDELRVTNGIARYTSNFEPQIQPFPNVAPAWTPANLFAANEVGAWYDPSDLSTLFQDDAGLTPVTGDGDPVGAMLDKSGNNLHAKQSGATLRPIYRTDGTKHWIEFNGSTVLTIDAPKADQRFMHDGTGLTCIGGYRFGSTDGEDGAFPIFGSDSGSSGKGGGFLSYDTRSQYNFSQSVRYFSTPAGSASYVANMKIDNVVPVNTDCSFEFSASAEKTPNLEVLQGGVVVGSDSYLRSTYTGDATYNYDIFAYGNGNGKTNGRLYGLLVINTILTRDDAGELTAFMKSKAGL